MRFIKSKYAKKQFNKKLKIHFQPVMEEFDYIIIGAGSAGCVLANRLSSIESNKILLLEAGGKDSYPWIHIPVGYYKTLHNPKLIGVLRLSRIKA